MRKIGELEINSELAFASKLVCPKCSDAKFGSRRDQNDGTLIRTCHGVNYDGNPCGFTWPSTDDHKYLYISALKLHAHGKI